LLPNPIRRSGLGKGSRVGVLEAIVLNVADRAKVSNSNFGRIRDSKTFHTHF
jgi:hypothetical protein